MNFKSKKRGTDTVYGILPYTSRKLPIHGVCPLLLFGLTFILFASPAHAQAKLKKLVFEDCDQAQTEMAQLQAADETEFLSYLTRVLKMQTGISGEIFAEGPGSTPAAGSRDVLTGGNMWRIFEPSREKEAKECALKLLGLKAERAFFTVPELIQNFQESSFPVELRDPLEETVWGITLAYKQKNSPADPKVFAALISELSSEGAGYLAAGVLLELHEAAIPYLVAALASPDMKKREAVQNLILRLDPAGTIIGPQLLPLLDSGDEDLRVKGIKLLSKLNGFYAQSLPAILNRLTDPSSTVTEAAFTAVKNIMGDDRTKASITLDAGLAPVLLPIFTSASFERRATLEPVLILFVSQHPEAAPSIIELKKSPEADLRERSVRILAGSTLPAETVLPVLYDALYDPALPVRLAAIKGLSANQEHAEEKASALLRVLKAAAADRDANARSRIIFAVAESSTHLPASPSLERMSPYFIEALAYEPAESSGSGESVSTTPAVQALLHIGPEISGALIKSLKDREPAVRRRAVQILAALKPVERQTGKALLYMLRDADEQVRAEAVRATLALGPEVLPDVKKGLAWKEPGAQLAAAEVLIAAGEKDPQLVGILRDNFSRVECSEKYPLVEPLVSLDPSYREKLQPFLLDCLLQAQTDPGVGLSGLDKVAPLKEDVLQRFLGAVKESSLSRNLRFQLLNHAARLGVPPADVAAQLIEFLKEPDNSLRTQTVAQLVELGEAGKAAVPALKDIVEDKNADGPLRAKAASAIAQLDPSAYDWQHFFIKEFESEHSQWAVTTVAEMSPAQAIPFLERALKEVSNEKRGLVVTLIAKFGADSQTLKPALVRLLKEGDPYTRVESVIALLQIDPQEPELLAAFRRELAGRYTKELLAAKLPATVAPLLEQIIAQPKSYVEGQTARALLAQMKSATQDKM